MSGNDELVIPLPHRVLHPGDTLTAEDVKALRKLCGLLVRNERRRVVAYTWRGAIRWNYEMLRDLHPDWSTPEILKVIFESRVSRPRKAGGPNREIPVRTLYKYLRETRGWYPEKTRKLQLSHRARQ